MPRFEPSLRNAFKDTRYIALHPEQELMLRIGQTCPELASFMLCRNIKSVAYLTGWNPFSQLDPAFDNQTANLRLVSDLQKARLAYYPCDGVDPTGQWPTEPGFLILDADRRWLKRLGRRYKQHALVYVSQTGRSRLVWTQHQ